MMGGLGGIVCFLLTHEILSTRQNMLAGLTVRRSETYAVKHLPTRSAAVRHCRDISPSAYERDLVTNEKV